MSERTNERRPASTMSTGAGIAVAGIWLAATAASIVFALILFVWSGEPTEPVEGGAVLIALFLIALPMVAAYRATMQIVLEDAD